MSDAVSNTDDARLQEIVRRLVKAFEPDRVYLFGSRARNDAIARMRKADTDTPSYCSLYSGGSMS